MSDEVAEEFVEEQKNANTRKKTATDVITFVKFLQNQGKCRKIKIYDNDVQCVYCATNSKLHILYKMQSISNYGKDMPCTLIKWQL